MQIIQPLLGTKAPPLGARASLCPNRLLFKKNSHILHGQSGFLKKIATRSPLINYSKFLLSKRPLPYIEWDNWEHQNFEADSQPIEFEPFDSRADERSKYNVFEKKGSNTDILPNPITSNISDEVKLNSQEKPQSKKPKKTQAKTKSPSGQSPSRAKTKSPSGQSPSRSQSKTKYPSPSPNPLQQHGDSSVTSTTSDSDSLALELPIPILPNLEEQPIFHSNQVKDVEQVIPLPSSKSAELLTTVNDSPVEQTIVRSPHDITDNTDNTTGDFPTEIATQQHDRGSISDIFPSRIDRNISDQTELNIPEKPQSQKPKKTPAKTKTKTKSPSGQSPSTAQSNTTSPSPSLQPSVKNLEEQPIFHSNQVKDVEQVIPLPSSKSAELLTTVNDSPVEQTIVRSPHDITDNTTGDLLTEIATQQHDRGSISDISPSRIDRNISDQTELNIPQTPQSQAQNQTPSDSDSVAREAIAPISTLPNAVFGDAHASNFVESESKESISNLAPLTSPATSDLIAVEKLHSSPSEAEPKIDSDKPAPQGFATGGHVTTTYVNNNQQVAPSDTVAAMLTPGEFVINARDAQKNLNLLQHINSGGTANDTIFTRLESNPQEQKEATSVESQTKVDSLQDTSLQTKNSDNISSESQTKVDSLQDTSLPPQNSDNISSQVSTLLQPKNSDNISSQVSNSLISSSLGLSIGKQRRSILSSPELNTNVSKTTNVGEPSDYSSPSLIFRQKNPPTDTPDQWWTVEELLASGDTDFNTGAESHRHSEFSQVTPHDSMPSESPKVFAKHLVAQPKGFADGGEVTSDINTKIQPITETIQRPPSSQKEEDDDANLEVLAREIYTRLRQRLEIERERYGVYSGRLPW